MFQQMQYFIAIVKNHSFTQAAVDCHISQSAISQQMKDLENTLGVTLLARKGRSFEVTAAGQYFYTHSLTIIADVAQLAKNTVLLGKPEAASLAIGYLRSFGTSEFLQTVSRFSQAYPQVKIHITSGSHEELFELLQTDEIDLAFSDQRRALSNAYQNEFLTASEFMVAVSQTLPVDAERLDIADLADFPCILIANQGSQESDETYYRDVLGVKGAFVLATSYDDAQMLVASNQGYLIINSRMQAQLNPEVVKLIRLTNGKQRLVQNYYAYWKADNSGFYIESFAELLKQSFG